MYVLYHFNTQCPSSPPASQSIVLYIVTFLGFCKYFRDLQNFDLLSTTLDTWAPCDWTLDSRVPDQWTLDNWTLAYRTPKEKDEAIESRAAPMLRIERDRPVT